MKVWIVKRIFDYEGFEIAGVYSDKAAAESRVKSIQLSDEVYDEIAIEEFVIDEDVA
jgi:hypothetical protein